jgi:hypothetical protein
MKIFINIIILMVTNLHFVIAQFNCIGNGEVIFYNMYASGVRVKVIPIGSIFSGPTNANQLDHKYSLKPSYRTPNSGTNWTDVVGGSRIMPLLPVPYVECNGDGYTVFDWDDGANYHSQQPQFVAGAVSYGLWKVEFWIENVYDEWFLINECWLDYRDWRAPEGCNLNDLFIQLRSNSPYIYFTWGNAGDDVPQEYIPINNQNVPDKHIEWYRQVRISNGIIFIIQCPNGINKGNYFTTNADNGYWLDWPIDAHRLNSNYEHINPEILDLNLSIVSNMQANIRSNKTMTIDNNSKLTLLSGSTLHFNSNSTLLVKSGSNICNFGGAINGYPRIIFERSGFISKCEYAWTGPITGGKIVLEDSAIVELADSTVLTFDSTSQLIMKPHSELRLGADAKIIFHNGANLFCDSAKFTSIDSNTTWDGIYLNDLSYDTLKNCTFENALNGINIADNVSLYDVPAVEISNCTFSNKTDQTLLNQVYVNNAANVLIRNCTSSSLISDGFSSGIILEYCTNGVNVIDNNINYAATGINVIQSSPYIARNTITGSTNGGTGIYLDNSNGTVEYNNINYFYNSMQFSYSSPYLLKNHFTSPGFTGMDLVTSSVPVMRPVNSGSLNTWLGGNNFFTGSPESGAIRLDNYAYPMMDSGYNYISVGSSNYMNGNISSLGGVLYLRVNYWYDNPPENGKFAVSGGDLDYSYPYDGSSLPGTDYFDLNSIGFDLYDTVYVDDLERNSLTPEDMFIIAYENEMQGRYADAITAYKDVISTYKTSNYAVSSISRIFNCLEKMNAGNNDYNSIKTYYTGLKNSGNYPVQVREISEDFAIKSKVRMGQVEDAISDYEAIMNNFPNTPKALHAEINKLCLENMQGPGDMNQGSMNNNGHKSKLLTLITGKEPKTNKIISGNLPKHFRLYQNYPNPFNPMTSIKYEIPKDGNIKLTVYDITGREIISINEYRQAGVYTYAFDGTNLASGVYIYKVVVGDNTNNGVNYVDTKKMVLIK